MLKEKNVFVSHSSENKEIAEHLCAFMMRLGIKEERIFCSSIVGQGVNNGEKLNDAIAKAINDSKMLVYIISRDFLESSYCMEELGAGWILSQQKKASCFYLIIPDINLSELKGFVNSKVDKFSFIDEEHKDELGLFAENICGKLKIKLPKHSVLTNAEKTFFSATKVLIASALERGENVKKEKERKAKQIGSLQEEIQRLKEEIKSYTNRIQLNNEEREKDLLRNELKTIRERFMYLGFDHGITPKIFHSIYKQFWFDMVNRYLELKEEFGDNDDCMDMLLATIYSANGDLDDAYEQLKLYVQHEESQIYPSFFRNVEIESSNDMSEIIEILQERIQHEPKGVVQDSYKETHKYLLDRKAKMK